MDTHVNFDQILQAIVEAISDPAYLVKEEEVIREPEDRANLGQMIKWNDNFKTLIGRDPEATKIPRCYDLMGAIKQDDDGLWSPVCHHECAYHLVDQAKKRKSHSLKNAWIRSGAGREHHPRNVNVDITILPITIGDDHYSLHILKKRELTGPRPPDNVDDLVAKVYPLKF